MTAKYLIIGKIYSIDANENKEFVEIASWRVLYGGLFSHCGVASQGENDRKIFREKV